MRIPFRALALVAALAGPALLAQDAQKPWTAGANLSFALDGLKNITHKSNGFVVDFGYTGHLGGTSVPFRTSFGYQFFPGSEELGLKTSLTSYQLAGDILIDTPWKNLQFITGLSLQKYHAKAEATGLGSTSENVKGTKFGARLGVEYQINSAWSAQLMVQMTELGTDATATVGINPSWLQAGVKFHF
jgi:hypothetical protein